jgi:hypothetical protein
VKFSRRCHCRKGCAHLARGSEALLPAERLLQLASIKVETHDPRGRRRVDPLLSLLIDCAEAYDSDGLNFDEACGIHGERAVSNSECSCRGERTSAVEFILALELDVKAAGLRDRPAGQPNRLHQGTMRLVASG